MLRKEWLWMLVSTLELANKTAETDDEHMLIDLLAKDLMESVEPVDRVD